MLCFTAMTSKHASMLQSAVMTLIVCTDKFILKTINIGGCSYVNNIHNVQLCIFIVIKTENVNIFL